MCITRLVLLPASEQDSVHYDLKYALRVRLKENKLRACVRIYMALKMYQEAVDLAMKVKRFSCPSPNHTQPYPAILSHTQPYSAIPSHTQPYSAIPSHTQPYPAILSHTNQFMFNVLFSGDPEAHGYLKTTI